MVECTLREAIQEANFVPGADVIAFNIFEAVGPALKTIRPASALPRIAETVTIDGYTQPGARPNTAAVGTNAKLLIELDGSNAGTNTTGLSVGAANSVVRGLVVNRFQSLSGGVSHGIAVVGPDATGVRITGNFLGTDAGGTLARGNHRGLFVAAQNTIVGGILPAARNLIAGNRTTGIALGGTIADFADGSRVQGNLIGTTRTGAAPLGNGGAGVATDVVSTLIGGNSAAAANVVAFNGGVGVLVFGGTGNRILCNSIFGNGRLGIDLVGASANDLGDGDAGPNTLQNKPVLHSATNFGAGISVRGELNSTPNQSYVLRFFANPSGEHEGQRFLGQRTVTTDAQGNAVFDFAPEQRVAVGQNVTATATNGGGNTSEFSAPRLVEPPVVGP